MQRSSHQAKRECKAFLWQALAYPTQQLDAIKDEIYCWCNIGAILVQCEKFPQRKIKVIVDTSWCQSSHEECQFHLVIYFEKINSQIE